MGFNVTKRGSELNDPFITIKGYTNAYQSFGVFRLESQTDRISISVLLSNRFRPFSQSETVGIHGNTTIKAGRRHCVTARRLVEAMAAMTLMVMRCWQKQNN